MYFWLDSGKLFMYYRMAVFMHWYINLEVFMPYWNIEQTTQNHGKGWEMGYFLRGGEAGPADPATAGPMF